jgi:serine/threonine-protein kinase
MTSLAAATGEEDALPRRFGPYLLFDKIGEGGMARIFLARTSAGLGGDRLIVVKEILPMLAASAEMSRLLVDEAKLCATLSHKNIVQVQDLGREVGRLYISMEYIEGLDLRELLKGCSQKKIPLPVEFSLFIVLETLRALDYAHRKRSEDGKPLGIVHRDVSPSNVLLSVEGEVKLCDFGIARVLATGEALPEEAIQGKAGYMSPEAARGDTVDVRSDVFAAGIVLWELMAGQRLYRPGGGRPPTIEQAREANIPPVPSRGHPDEDRLFSIVRRALARDPVGRYQSAQEMLTDLEGYVADNRLVVSTIRFGDWLTEHFGAEMIERRRARERAAKALEESLPRPEPPRVPPERAELETVPDVDAESRAAASLKVSDAPPPFTAPRKAGNPFVAVLVVLVFIVAGAGLALLLGQR